MHNQLHTALLVCAATNVLASSKVDSLLNSTYTLVKFGQNRSNIEKYSLGTFQYAADAAWHPFGYLQSSVTQLAIWDVIHGTRTFESAVQQALDEYASNSGPCHTYWKIPLANDFNDFASWTGIGAMYAYSAYGNETYLEWAKGMFQFVSDVGYISESDIEAGYLVNVKSDKNGLSATCNGQSMVGGIYWQNGCPGNRHAREDPSIAAVSTGAYAVLGASLCRATGNTTYCDRAYSSLQWLDRHLLRDGLIESHVQGNSCHVGRVFSACKNFIGLVETVCIADSRADNTALYLGAYADLGNFTKNATALSIGQNAAVQSMITHHWNNEQGVITSGAGNNLTQNNFQITFGPVLIRYLRSSYQYFNSSVQEAIINYVNIQYFALTQNDSNSRSTPHFYGRNWTGPSYAEATNETINAALDVLNAVSLNPNSSFPNSSQESSSQGSGTGAKSGQGRVAPYGGSLRNAALAAIVPALLMLCI